VSHVNESHLTYVNESCHICELSHVTYVHESIYVNALLYNMDTPCHIRESHEYVSCE